jgi:predicted secreted protein
MVELNEASAGHPVETHVGQRLRITLPENRTTGYSWHVVGDCAQILSQENDQITPAPSGQPGAPSQRAWVFAPKSEGQCELRFESTRSWEKFATGKTLSFPVTVMKSA